MSRKRFLGIVLAIISGIAFASLLIAAGGAERFFTTIGITALCIGLVRLIVTLLMDE